MSRKTIKIDLSLFFDDERKMSCILMDPTWKSVACLQTRIELLFDISPVMFLGDGCFLPPQESIEIINHFNDIKVFVPNKIRKEKKSKKSKDIEQSLEKNVNEEAGCPDSVKQQKRKSSCLVSTPFHNGGSSYKSKRSKNIDMYMGNNIAHTPKIDDGEIETEISQIGNACTSKEFKVRSQDEEISCEGDLTSKFFGEQHKQPYNSTPKEGISKKSNHEITEGKLIKAKHNREHTYFDESGEVVNSSTKRKSQSTLKNEKEIIIFRCPLSDVTNDIKRQKTRIFHLKAKNSTNNSSKKQVLEIQEDIILPPLPLSVSVPTTNEEIKEANCVTDVKNLLSSTSITTINGNGNKEEMSATEFEVPQKKRDLTKRENGIEMKLPNFTADIIERKNKFRLNFTNIEDVSEGQEKLQLRVGEIKNNSEVRLTNTNESVGEALKKTDIKEENAEETSKTIDCVDLSVDLHDKSNVEENDNSKQDLTKSIGNNLSSESDVEEISEIIVLNETEDNCQQKNHSIKDDKVNEISPFTIDLTNMLKVGDKIRFKMPRVKKDSRNISTDFMGGNVEYINKRTKYIKILITDGDAELRHVPESLIFHNMDDSRFCKKYLHVKITDLLEAKLAS